MGRPWKIMEVVKEAEGRLRGRNQIFVADDVEAVWVFFLQAMKKQGELFPSFEAIPVFRRIAVLVRGPPPFVAELPCTIVFPRCFDP